MGHALTRPRRPARGFTLVELLVVIAIVALLMAILMPALRQAREMARAAVCLSHERNLMLAVTTYVQETGHIPPLLFDYPKPIPNSPYCTYGDPWWQVFWRDGRLSRDVLGCPSSNRKGFMSVWDDNQPRWVSNGVGGGFGFIGDLDHPTKPGTTYNANGGWGAGIGAGPPNAPLNYPFQHVVDVSIVYDPPNSGGVNGYVAVHKPLAMSRVAVPSGVIGIQDGTCVFLTNQYIAPRHGGGCRPGDEFAFGEVFNAVFLDGHATGMQKGTDARRPWIGLPAGMWTIHPND